MPKHDHLKLSSFGKTMKELNDRWELKHQNEEYLKGFETDPEVPLEDYPDVLGGVIPFLDGLSQKITGFAGESYRYRNRDKLLSDFSGGEIPNRKRYKPEMRDTGLLKKLKQLVEGKVVLELGCGKNGDGYIIADVLRARGYIGTEILLPKSADSQIRSFKGWTPHHIVSGDFVDYITKLKESQKKVGVIIMAGVDRDSFLSERRGEEEPGYRVFECMDECLEVGGIVIVDDPTHLLSRDHGLGKKYKELEIFKEIGGSYPMYIFQKQQ